MTATKKTIASRVTALLSALLISFSMLENVDDIFVYSEELEEMTEVISSFEESTEGTTSEPESFEIYPAYEQIPQEEIPEETDFIDEEYLPEESEDSDISNSVFPKVQVQNIHLNAADGDETVTYNAEDYYAQTAENSVRTFNAYYTFDGISTKQGVNDTSLHIEKTEDFVFEYAIDFNSILPISKGDMRIRVPAQIFPFRNGSYVLPEVSFKPVTIGENGKLIDPSTGLEVDDSNNKDTTLRYYMETGDDGKIYYIFVNTTPVKDSSSLHFTVVYKDSNDMQDQRMKVYDIPDNTTWEIQPELSVTYHFNQYYVSPLTGKANTALTKVIGSDGNTYYRVVSTNNAYEYEYFSPDRIDPNTGNPITNYKPDYYSDKDGNYYHVPDDSQGPVDPITITFTPVTYQKEVIRETAPLDGKIDTTAEFNSITKNPLPNPNAENQISNLYNNDQVSELFGHTIDEKYFAKNSNETQNVPVVKEEDGQYKPELVPQKTISHSENYISSNDSKIYKIGDDGKFTSGFKNAKIHLVEVNADGTEITDDKFTGDFEVGSDGVVDVGSGNAGKAVKIEKVIYYQTDSAGNLNTNIKNSYVYLVEANDDGTPKVIDERTVYIQNGDGTDENGNPVYYFMTDDNGIVSVGSNNAGKKVLIQGATETPTSNYDYTKNENSKINTYEGNQSFFVIQNGRYISNNGTPSTDEITTENKSQYLFTADKYGVLTLPDSLTGTFQLQKTEDIIENQYLVTGWRINVNGVHGRQPWQMFFDESAFVKKMIIMERTK